MLLSSLSLSVPLAREQGPLCPRDCMGRGLCTGSGVCICNETFSGAACDRASSRCPAQCSGHGSCSVDGCTCDIGYGGDDCSAVRPVCPHNCGGHGTCSQGSCACDQDLAHATARWHSRTPARRTAAGMECARSADVSATRASAARLVTNPCRLRVAQLHALAEARVTPAPACACEASAAQAASLRRRSPRAHPTVRGAARVSTACAGATRDGPGARATASSRSRVHLTWAARLRARPTASAS